MFYNTTFAPAFKRECVANDGVKTFQKKFRKHLEGKG